MKRLAGLVLLVLVLGAGCRSLTGRSMGQWADDRTITAMVKTQVAETTAGHSSRIRVDTYDRTVYLTGGVETPEMKRRAEEISWQVPNVALVVNNLHVLRSTPAASPPTEAATLVMPRAFAGGERLVRLDVESGTPTWTRYAGYDSEGRRIATVFAVLTIELSNGGVRALPVDLPVDHLSVRPDGATAYVVMWHDKHVNDASTR
ncbi:MAG: hypothetical protein AUH30_16185 [Candidatus Rokubacteria bacterium 13_1_40CM_68_15]|nr:MAG: hypothetical protein AUH30_16185 [Candidatus Rokubacteria bacterium 13_1_40CM_68_15]